MNRENGMDGSGEPEGPRALQRSAAQEDETNKKEGVETTVSFQSGKHRAIPFVSPIRSPPEAEKRGINERP